MDRADMTHPLTPREKVEPFERYPALASWIAKMANVGSGLSLGEWMTFVGSLNAAIVQAEQRTALASGSGDHAELATLREHRITADLVVSTLKADKEEAERKLAEAVGLLREAIEPYEHISDVRAFEVMANGPATRLVAIRAFLSKEAERG